AINRKNDSIIIAGANDNRMYSKGGMPSYTSVNQGKTWVTYWVVSKNADFPQTLGDPAIATDDSGYFYYASIVADDISKYDNLIVASSKDGKSWQIGNPIVPSDEVQGFEDKEHITVDNNPKSPFYGRVYVAWMHFVNTS